MALSIPRRVAVIGSANMDFFAQVASLPAPGETVRSASFDKFFGGKGANQAVQLARLGAETLFVGCVGDDDMGRAMLGRLKSEGVDASRARVDPRAPSGMAMVITSPGDNIIVIHGGANMALSAQDVLRAEKELARCDAILCQLEIPQSCIAQAALIALRRGIPFFLNPAPYRPLPREILQSCAVITPNLEEAASLLGVRVKADGALGAEPGAEKATRTAPADAPDDGEELGRLLAALRETLAAKGMLDRGFGDSPHPIANDAPQTAPSEDAGETENAPEKSGSLGRPAPDGPDPAQGKMKSKGAKGKGKDKDNKGKDKKKRRGKAKPAGAVSYRLETTVAVLEPAAPFARPLTLIDRDGKESPALLQAACEEDPERIESVMAVARAMRAGDLPLVATIGSLGVLRSRGGRTLLYPPCRGNPVDPTGAGDAFSAALCRYMPLGFDAAVGLAQKTASLVIGRKGAQEAMPTAEEAEKGFF